MAHATHPDNEARRGALAFVCVSDRRGVPKQAVDRARLVAGHGIAGDSHAGSWHRQISILAEADIDSMRDSGLELPPGAFGENLVLSGLDLDGLGPGTRLAVGDAELVITQVGKECHSRCAIYVQAGDCIMPRVGLFARVTRDGVVTPGDPVEVLEAAARNAPAEATPEAAS